MRCGYGNSGNWKRLTKSDWIVLFLYVVGILLVVLGVVGLSWSAEVCMSEETAKRMLVVLQQKRLLENEVKEQEVLVENLKKQIELLKEQNKLLGEQVKLLREQVGMYKELVDVAERELRRKERERFVGNVKSFGVGVLLGVLVGVLML